MDHVCIQHKYAGWIVSLQISSRGLTRTVLPAVFTILHAFSNFHGNMKAQAAKNCIKLDGEEDPLHEDKGSSISKSVLLEFLSHFPRIANGSIFHSLSPSVPCPLNYT